MQKVAEQEMTVATQDWLFTVDDYYKMGEVGIFDEDARVELLEGKVFEMTPIGLRHASCVDRLNHLFVTGVGERAIVRVQGPIQLDEHSSPQPDLALLQPKANFYTDAIPTLREILLVVEVADSSITFDRAVKVPLYAQAGLPEVWIVNLAQNVVEVYWNPSPEGYGSVQQVAGNQQLAPQAFPELVLEAGSLFGTGANTDT